MRPPGMQAREPMLAKYLLTVRSMDKWFDGFHIKYIDCKQNDEADELTKAASRKQPVPLNVFF